MGGRDFMAEKPGLHLELALWKKGNNAKVTFSLRKRVLMAYCNLITKQGAEDENPEWIIPNNTDCLQM